MFQPLQRLEAWLEASTPLPPGLTQLRLTLRILWWSAQEATRGPLTLHAMGLAYTTLLSLVPLLAVSFSVLKAFGVHNQIEPLLLRLLEPLGDKSVEITAQIVGFVENIKVGVLGALGVALLFYTVVALMQKIERGFNATWRVRAERPLSQRFAYYLSVILIGPVLVFTATALSAALLHTNLVREMAAIGPLGELLGLITRLTPYVMIVAAFTFIYLFVPNTRVRLPSALFGGLIAGLLWETVGWLFASLVSTSGNYTAVYSAFASLVLFMVWISVAWMILLIGATLAYAHQNREALILATPDQEPDMAARERLALALMQHIARRFEAGEPPPTRASLARTLNLPQEWLDDPLEKLTARGLLRATADEAGGWVPGRPPTHISAADVLAALRESQGGAARIALPPELEQALNEADIQHAHYLHAYHFAKEPPAREAEHASPR